VLVRGLDLNEANKSECALIRHLDTLAPNGYNLVGDRQEGEVSDATRRRLSASLRIALKTPAARRNRSIGQSARRRLEAESGYVHPALPKAAAARRRAQLAEMRADPELTRRRKNAVRAALATTETRQKMSAAQKARLADPAQFEKFKLFVQAGRSKEARCKMVATMNAIYSDQARLAARNAAISRGNSTPEAVAKSSARHKIRWEDPEFRSKTIAAMNAPDVVEKRSAAGKRLWADPAYRERMTAAIRRGKGCVALNVAENVPPHRPEAVMSL